MWKLRGLEQAPYILYEAITHGMMEVSQDLRMLTNEVVLAMRLYKVPRSFDSTSERMFGGTDLSCWICARL